MRLEQVDPIHKAAVGLALGLLPPFDLLFLLDLTPDVELGDFLYNWTVGEDETEYVKGAALIEKTTRLASPDFSLSGIDAERAALSLIEDQCLVLSSGIGGLDGLQRALPLADRLFDCPAWIGAKLRASFGTTIPSAAKTQSLVEDLRPLLDRVQRRIADIDRLHAP